MATEDAIKREFGLRLKTLRKALGLTQEEASRRSGVPQPQWSRIERGLHDPQLSTAVQMAAGLGVDSLGLLLEGLAAERS